MKTIINYTNFSLTFDGRLFEVGHYSLYHYMIKVKRENFYVKRKNVHLGARSCDKIDALI